MKDNNYGEKTSLITGYAVYKVLDDILKSDNLKFKWPNDIYYEDRKICGILCEKVRNHIIIGIGININNSDFGIFRDKAVSLFEITGIKEDVDSIIKETVVLFEEKIRTFNKEWEKIINLMNNKNYLNGKIIKIKTNGNFEDKIYKVSRIERSGKISILGKGDLDEKEFESLEFEVIN